MPQRLKGGIKGSTKPAMHPHDLKNEIEFESFEEFIGEFKAE